MSKYIQSLLLFGYLSFIVIWSTYSFLTVATDRISGRNIFWEVKDGNTTAIAIADFVQFYKVGKIITSCDRLRIYEPAVQLDWTNKIISPAQSKTIFYAQSVPFLCVFMALFAGLPIKVAFFSLCILCFVLGIWGFWLLGREVLRLGTKEIGSYLLATASSAFSFVNFLLGQLSWLVVGVVSLYLKAFLQGNQWLAGMFLALSSFKLQYCPILIMPICARKQWKALAAFFVTEIVLNIVAAQFIGWQNIIRYPYFLAQSINAPGVNADSMVNLRGMLLQMLSAQQATPIVYATYFMALLGVFLLWWREKDSCDRLRVAITILLLLITSPHTHMHDCMLLAIPAMFLMAENYQIAATTKIIRGMFIALPLISWIVYLYFPACRWVFATFSILLLLFIINLYNNYKSKADTTTN